MLHEMDQLHGLFFSVALEDISLSLTRILIPNLAKLIQGAIIILFVSFMVIVQSTYIIDLLKYF